MSENKTRKSIISRSVIKMFAAGFVLFACAVAFTPSSGVFRTIPFFVIGGAVAFLLGASTSVCASLSFIMTLFTYLVSGRGTGESVFYAAVSCLLTLSGVYAVRFFKASKRTSKKDTAVKCRASAFSALAVALVLSFALCGNVVSFLFALTQNGAYIDLNYGNAIEKRYTSYEAFDGEYRTYVSFADEGGVYGNADECYVLADKKHFNDDVRNYYEDKILVEAEARLAYAISGATWGYNITASDIDFSIGEILTPDSKTEDYLNRVRYVVGFESLFDEDDRDKFVSICEDTVSAIEANGIEFDKIVLCGGDASKVLFSLTLTSETQKADVDSLVEIFDEEQVSEMGVTEMTILDYWKNR